MTRESLRRALRRLLGHAVTCAGLALACGERAPAPDADPAVASRTRSAPAPDPARTTDARTPVPEAFARACIAGDPAEGIPWRLDAVGLVPITAEAIESMAARDSARLAARIARMVDVIPSDTTVADFRGLPVTVRAAWRLTVAEGDTVVIALAARRMPIESAPLEELFALVAAPGQRSGVRDPLVEGWFVREVGSEERLVARDLVGAYLDGTDLLLAFTEDTDAGVRAVLVTRAGGAWRATWTGQLQNCPAP